MAIPDLAPAGRRSSERFFARVRLSANLPLRMTERGQGFVIDGAGLAGGLAPIGFAPEVE
jgi:hypothetical protein